MPLRFEGMPKARRIARLKKACDTAWSSAVRQRDGACRMCGSKKNLHAHHWYAQKARSLALRWNMHNGVALCYPCHMFKVHRYSVWVDLAPLFAQLTNALGEAYLNYMDIACNNRDVSWCTESWLNAKLDELLAMERK